MYTAQDHTFVIIAYKENPYLEETIKSVKNQTCQGEVICATSTPNEYIEGLCSKYGIKLFIHNDSHGIGSDWNFAYDQAKTSLVTLAHQDDNYELNFVEETINHINKRKKDDSLIVFTDYYEMKHDHREYKNTLLTIKRVLNLPLKVSGFSSKKIIRRRILAFGNPICCPSVTYNKKHIGNNLFDESMKNSMDYKCWVELSKQSGSFIYVPKPLMGHRIYAESTTTSTIADNSRSQEDLAIMSTLWPKPIARFIFRFYKKGEDLNGI